MEIKIPLKNIGVGVVKKWVWPVWSQALKLAVSQEGINGIS